MSEKPVGTCKNPDCRFNDGGDCVEGFALEDISEKCPNFTEGSSESLSDNENVGVVSENKQADKPTQPGEFTSLSSGKALPISRAYTLMANRPAKIVLCAGHIGHGKTTFLTSIYELYRRQTLANHLFAGSLTLLGFEERCHLSRTASGNENAHTERTSVDADDIILHLVLKSDSGTSGLKDILLVDISGEFCRDARNSTEDANKIPLIAATDFFVLFFSGEKLANPQFRHKEKRYGLDLLRSCLEAKAIGRKTNVQIILSKMDDVNLATDTTEDSLKFFEQICDEIKNSYKDKFRSLSFHKIASRPRVKSGLPEGYGVEAVINEWLKDSVPSPVTRRISEQNPKTYRCIDMFEINTSTS